MKYACYTVLIATLFQTSKNHSPQFKLIHYLGTIYYMGFPDMYYSHYNKHEISVALCSICTITNLTNPE